jgi:hypothetical protein
MAGYNQSQGSREDDGSKGMPMAKLRKSVTSLIAVILYALPAGAICLLFHFWG